MYLTRILYKSSSCDKWAEHELDYILFFKDYNNDIIPQPNPDEIQVFIIFIINEDYVKWHNSVKEVIVYCNCLRFFIPGYSICRKR